MKHISSIDRGDVKLAYDRAVAHDVEDVADMLEAFAEYIDRLEKQRDELLKALENTHNALKHFWPEGHVDAIAAIASVKENSDGH